MNLSKEQLGEMLNKNPDLGIKNMAHLNALGLATDGIEQLKGRKTRAGKYNATPAAYGGITYPSKHEAQTAADLDLLKKAGQIDFYLRQVPFSLPGGVVYRADFVTFKYLGDNKFYVKVIEAKGHWTPEWKIKYKLFREVYPNLAIEVV